MATWQELTVPGLVTSVVTGGALLLQNWRNGVREDKRRADYASERQKDRDHARDMAELVARRQLDERWRDDRREAYAAMISNAEACISLTDRIHEEHVRELEFGIPATDATDLVERLQTETQKLPRHLSLVVLLGSQESRRESELLGSLLDTMMMSAWMLDTVLSPPDARRAALASTAHAAGHATTQLRQFVDTVRRDLGTT